ncbi:ABC transporter permease [Paenibacillus eucommiae]|uniref:ABC-type polysaccharide transport system permease subunit n=1 Tax=Paenibacillus eucommiae TaxID=1355755 RepID=A0ABS4J870_9BACL|nr:ABC transporter permease subunit [Paenibacillus eucommiae]MBP1996039.1 ABC-type polysaccharide transport system permease subunit [Paenibacillus eucommiae]
MENVPVRTMLQHAEKKRRYMNKTELQLLLTALPFFLLVLVFTYVPLLGWSMAFVNYIPGVPITESQFVGFKFFKMIFGYGSDLPKAILNTLAMGFLNILVSPLPMILAILLNEVRRSKIKRFIQTSVTLPNFISMIIVYSVFFSFLSVDGGVMNELLLKIGIIKEPLNLLGNSSATWYFQTFVGVWKTIGWGAIIFLGAIASIDTQLYDAASVDGAGRFRQALHITVPGLMPTFSVLLLLGIGNLLTSNFEQIYVFHNALVHDKIETLDYYTYRIGLINFDFSLSTAIGMFKSVISLILLFSVNLIMKKVNGYSII